MRGRRSAVRPPSATAASNVVSATAVFERLPTFEVAVTNGTANPAGPNAAGVKVRLTAEKVDHFRAARLLRFCQVDVEQHTAGVGIDLDELRAVFREVEIVAEEHTACPKSRCAVAGAVARTASR